MVITLNDTQIRKLINCQLICVSIRNIRDIAKTAYIPQDRLLFGVASEATIKENLLANRLSDPEISKAGIVKEKQLTRKSRELIREFTVKCDSEKQTVDMLSGGNIQKVVVARECSHDPKVLIAEQPTRGVDIGAAHIIHKKIMELRDNGCAVLLISADLSEALKLSDVIAVMYEGEIVAYFDNTEGLNEEKLGLYMLGLERHGEEQIRRARG